MSERLRGSGAVLAAVQSLLPRQGKGPRETGLSVRSCITSSRTSALFHIFNPKGGAVSGVNSEPELTDTGGSPVHGGVTLGHC